MNQRLAPEDRREQILAAALSLARSVGYNKITRDGIAIKAECSQGLVTRYFATMKQLRRAVMRAAIQEGDASLVAQGLGVGDIHAKKAPAELKQKALGLLAA